MTDRPTLHCLGLPHTNTTREYDWCAYTAKLRKWGDMMTAQGYPVIIYGGTQNEAACQEHVEIVSEEERARYFGDYDATKEAWDGWEPGEHWDVMNMRALWQIKARIQEGDLICIMAGVRQQVVAEAFPAHASIEPFVGYEGTFTDHCAFESYAWMHTVYAQKGIHDGRFFDAVIPNYFDPMDFNPALKRDDYLLFIGRLIDRKGPGIAAQLAERTGLRLLVAGQGDPAIAPGCEYLGVLNPTDRMEVMGKAAAVVVPTLYLEPFGGVAVEAMLSGAPVITHDWGAMTETVSHGRTGFRCRTLGDMVEAVESLDRLLPAAKIAAEAKRRYSMDEVGPQFTAWLERVAALRARGDRPPQSWDTIRGTHALSRRYGNRR